MFFLQCFLCEEKKKGKYWAISLFGLCFVDNKCNDDQSCGYEIFILPRKQSNFANIAIYKLSFFLYFLIIRKLLECQLSNTRLEYSN